MAYVQEPEQDQEEKKQQDAKYAALLGTAPAGGEAAAPSASPAPAPKTSTGFGFVSADRYLNANKGTVDRMNSEAKSELAGRADKVTSGLQSTTNEITTKASEGTLRGPQANTAVQAPNTNATQLEALTSLTGSPHVSRDTAQGFVDANYSGPTSTDVSSRYGQLFADYGGVKEDTDAAAKYGLGAVKKWNAFDSMLSNAAGGRNVRDVQQKVSAFEPAYTDSRKAAETAVTEAANSHDESRADSAAGKYAALIGEFDQGEKDAADAATKADAEAMTKSANDFFKASTGRERASEFSGRPKGDEILSVYDRDPVGVGVPTYNELGQMMGMSRDQLTGVFDRMSDGDMKKFLSMANGKTPIQELRKFLYGMTNLYGVK